MKNQHYLKSAAFILFIIFSNLFAFAQEEIIIGYKANKKNSNTTIEKGAGMGVPINTGKKTIKLSSVELEIGPEHPEWLKFYVRIFPMEGKKLLQNIGPNRMFVQKIDLDMIFADLTHDQISLHGKYMVAFEWAETPTSDYTKISFATSALKKAVYHRDNDDESWKKVPLLGVGIIIKGFDYGEN